MASSYGDFEYMNVAQEDRILDVVLNKPKKANAYTRDDVAEMLTLFEQIRADEALRAVVVTAAGPHFSAGHDRHELPDMGGDRVARGFELARRFVHLLLEIETPIVTAVHGAAIGSPLVLVLLSDIALAEPSARFIDTHTAIGLVPASASLLWARSMGLMRAKRHLLLGDWIDAQEAERIGLVSELVEEGRGREQAFEYAQRLAAMPPLAVRYTKRALNAWLRTAVNPVFEPALALEYLCMSASAYGDSVANATEHRP